MTPAGGGVGVNVTVTGVNETAAGVEKVQKGLDPLSANMREAIREAGDGLARALVAAANASPTPQARLVAQSIQVSQVTDAEVKLGGGQAVGSRGTPAGELVEGSEHGGRNFVAPKNRGRLLDRPDDPPLSRRRSGEARPGRRR